ncbi:activating transcription factor 7-interacting protein 1 [Trichonephila clavata]|uniref:Activating transcription factor 7-interacting protein 1 n=1 Tax=Trichonephila clavata TaxID=2740835 RepID=A0A8X6HJ18_TRICU|nr:activating transcription factor 7-interacting protein 1 [Trichonephila clavata]
MAQKLEKDEEKMEVDEESYGEEERQQYVKEFEHLAEGYVDDESEEAVLMTYKEIEDYILKKMAEYSKDPSINPIIPVKKRARELLDQVKDTKEKIEEANNSILDIYNDQINVLEHVAVLPKEGENNVPTKESAEAKELSPSVGPSASSGSVLKSSANANQPNPNLKSDRKVDCIDLTEDTSLIQSSSNATVDASKMLKHPVPVPAVTFNIPNKNLPELPPKPSLQVSSAAGCIVLQWDMPSNISACAKLSCFELFAYQETQKATEDPPVWRKIGSVKPLSMPMVLTLSALFTNKQNNERCPTV